jgi:hypothetical protein
MLFPKGYDFPNKTLYSYCHATITVMVGLRRVIIKSRKPLAGLSHRQF